MTQLINFNSNIQVYNNRGPAPCIAEEMVSVLGNDITQLVLSYLEFADLEAYKQLHSLNPHISFYWEKFNFKEFFPNLTFFGMKEWQEHFFPLVKELMLEDLLVDPSTLYSILTRLNTMTFVEKLGSTLLMIPKGLSLKALLEYVLAIDEIEKTFFFLPLLSSLKEIIVEKTYFIVIADGIVLDSESLDVDSQNTMLQNNGCRASTFLETTVLMIISAKLKKPSFIDFPKNAMRCSAGENQNVVVQCRSSLVKAQLVANQVLSGVGVVFDCHLKQVEQTNKRRKIR